MILASALPHHPGFNAEASQSHPSEPLWRPKGVDDNCASPPLPLPSELLGQEVVKCDDCIGEEVTSKVAAMQNGQVCC